jgi:ATP-dependent DNA helicase RecG
MDSKALSVDNPQLLDNLNLLNNDIPKRTAILLFHHKPEKWIPGSFIKIGYFKSDSEIVYQDEVHGSLISQAEKYFSYAL